MNTHAPEPDDQYEDPGILDDHPHTPDTSALPEPPHPINWNLLPAQDIGSELL